MFSTPQQPYLQIELMIITYVTPYFYYSFILSSLVSFYIFYMNNCGMWVFVICVSNISSLLKILLVRE